MSGLAISINSQISFFCGYIHVFSSSHLLFSNQSTIVIPICLAFSNDCVMTSSQNSFLRTSATLLAILSATAKSYLSYIMSRTVLILSIFKSRSGNQTKLRISFVVVSIHFAHFEIISTTSPPFTNFSTDFILVAVFHFNIVSSYQNTLPRPYNVPVAASAFI